MVYAPCHNPSQQHQHWATCPPQHQHIMPRAMAPPPTMACPPSQNMGVVSLTCYLYINAVHFAKEGMALRQVDVPCPRGHTHHPLRLIATMTDRVSYTTMENITEIEPVLTGTFSLNGHPIVILFDIGATHNFISKACTQKHQLVIQSTNTPYVISTPGGRDMTKQLVMYTPLNQVGNCSELVSLSWMAKASI
jgi:hypothetical protein